MSNGFNFNNDGNVDELEEFLTFDLTQKQIKNMNINNGGCLTATLTMLIVPVVLIVSLIQEMFYE